MPLLLSICTRRLFSKLTDFKPGVAAIATPEILRPCSSEAFGHKFCHWVCHPCDTSSGFTLSCLVLLCLYCSGLWQTTCVMAAHLVIHWRQSLEGRHHIILGWRATTKGTHGLLKDYWPPIWNNWISSVTFKRQAISKKTSFWAVAPFLHSFH